MVEEYTDNQIYFCIDCLIDSLGIQKEISASCLQEIAVKFHDQHFKDAIILIRRNMKLQMVRIRIKYITDHIIFDELDKHYPEKRFPPAIVEHYVRKNIMQERSVKADWVADVELPERMPLFGTREFCRMEFKIRIRRSYCYGPFKAFLCAIAHELAHIVINSISHPLRNSDVATDLFMMIAGFSDVMKEGRMINETSRLGYLNDHQFKLAYDYLKKLKRKKFA